ncbi:hypothetical protein [Novosphingobium resinovorum]|uniref:Uncharacterized protein n=1 Tax=Novosphingobium resinovorum TaxID=158500 RepID=A0A1D8A538_9SPHN|nr:hypothetical protein [Novosphingobium resinovorum]AOR77206.1 hypothetical protein BES08_10930 [Novosphingobium resinovorum]
MITLPFPPSSLSGHAEGVHWASKAKLTKKWRAWAFAATLVAKVSGLPADGDIVITVTFYPPNRRSDRTNFANRMKPIFDGIAEALKVNDRRFVPVYKYADPVKPGRVEVSF